MHVIMTTDDDEQASVIHDEDEIDESVLAAPAGRTQATQVLTESDQNGVDAADVRSGAKLKRFAFTCDLNCCCYSACDKRTHTERFMERNMSSLTKLERFPWRKCQYNTDFSSASVSKNTAGQVSRDGGGPKRTGCVQ